MAVTAAFLLVPTAQALANGTMTVIGSGSGSGDVTSGNSLGVYKGTPSLACHWTGANWSPGTPGFAECTNETSAEGEGIEATFLSAKADYGSEFAGWVVLEEGFGRIACKAGEANCGPYDFEGENTAFEVEAIFEPCAPGSTASSCVSKMKVNTAGSGEGVVVGKSFSGAFEGKPKMECHRPSVGGDVCENTMVTESGEEESGPRYDYLEAKAASGSKFVEWTIQKGNFAEPLCGSKPLVKASCLFSVGAQGEDAEVTAIFASTSKPKFKLNLTTSGSGSGSFQCKVNGGSEEACATEYEEGKSVQVVPHAAGGSEFVEFTGDCSGASCTVTMNAEHNVGAVFNEEASAEPNLALNIEEGSGTVVSNPAGLECSGSAPKTCEVEVAEGKVVLTASPAPGYLVKSWKGCDTGGVNGRQCTVTATSSLKTVGVKFYKVFSLEGSKSGGLGIMGTAPGGINCGYACSSSTALYKEGSLTVKAKPAKNFHFVEFTGGTGSASSCNGVTTPECTIATFNSNSAIEEVYAEDAKNTLTLTKEGGGQGFVKTKPTNINCGLTCTVAKASFFASESPEVTVALGKGTSSVTWTTGAGTCTGNALTCTVPMSASHSLVAKFN